MKTLLFFLIISFTFNYISMPQKQEKYKIISWNEFIKLYPNVFQNEEYEVDMLEFNYSEVYHLPDGNYFMKAMYADGENVLIYDKKLLDEIKKNEFLPFAREANLLSVKYRDKVAKMEENYMFFIDLLQQKLDTILPLEYNEENLRLLYQKIIQKKLDKNNEVFFLVTVYVCVILKKECKNMLWTTERGVIGLNYYLYPDLYSKKRGYRFDVPYKVSSKIKRKKGYEDYFVKYIGYIVSDYYEAEKK